MIDLLRVLLSRWKAWREGSVNRRVFAAMLTVGSFTVLVKLIATVKEVIVARQFGTSDALDAFLIAFLVPQFIATVIGDSFSGGLIPTYIQVRQHKGWEAAQRLLSSVMAWSSVFLVGLSALLALSAPYLLPILASGFGPEKLALTRLLFYVLLPTLVIYGLSRIWAAIINAGERFALVAAAPIITSALTVAFLLLLGNLWGIYSYVVGVVGGLALEAALVAWSLRRQGFSLNIRWHGLDSSTRQVISQYTPTVAAAFLFSSSTLIDQAMAAMLGPGSVSTLNYGSKVVLAINGVAILAVATAVLPHFSKMVTLEDWTGLRHTLKTYIGLIFIVSVPLTLGLVYFSEPLVSLLFQRGAFTTEDTHLVSQVQALFLLQVPFVSAGMLLVRLTSSLHANHWLIWSAVIGVTVNVVLNYVLMQWLGVAGIALSTSAVFVVMFCCHLLNTLRLLGRVAHKQDTAEEIR